MDASVESSDFQSSCDYDQKQGENQILDIQPQEINFDKKEKEDFNKIRYSIESC